MRTLLLFLLLTSCAFSLEISTPKQSGVCTASITYMKDIGETTGYTVNLNYVVENYQVLFTDVSGGKFKYHKITKEKAHELLALIRNLINETRIDGDNTAKGPKEAYSVGIMQNGYHLTLSYPTSNDGFDNSKLENIFNAFKECCKE